MCTARGRCYGGGLLILLAFACLFCANGFTPMVLLNPARPQVYPASASSAADASSWCSLSRPVGRVRLPREELVPNYRAHARGISLKMQERGGNRAGRGRRGGRGGARSSSAGGERGPQWLDDLDAGKAGRKRPNFARLRKESNREVVHDANSTNSCPFAIRYKPILLHAVRCLEPPPCEIFLALIHSDATDGYGAGC